MSNDLHNSGAHNEANGANGHGDYEREDFSTATVVGSLIGLAVMCIVSFVIVVGMYRYLDKTQMEHVAANPMVPMKADAGRRREGNARSTLQRGKPTAKLWLGGPGFRGSADSSGPGDGVDRGARAARAECRQLRSSGCGCFGPSRAQ